MAKGQVPERQPSRKLSGSRDSRSQRTSPVRHSAGMTRRSPLPQPPTAASLKDGDRVQSAQEPVPPTAYQHSSQDRAPGPVPRPRRAPAKPARSRRIRFDWLYQWQLWVMLMGLFITGSAVLALMLLLRIPGLPNCPAIFWPLASASLRFECARLAASKQTAHDLLEAIELVDSLPANHSMRQEANRLVEEWSQSVLKLADEDFNLGKLGDAIAAARRIPAKVSAHKLVEERIQHWQTVWAEAEGFYKKAEDYMRQQNFRQAFAQATQLLDVENKFWQTIKYDELTARIRTTKDDASKLGRAYRLADDGGLTNLLAAIKLAEEISPESYIYAAAQTAIPKIGRKMLQLAEALLEQHNLKDALEVLNKIPDSTDLKEEVRDYTVLANAQSMVWQNNIPSIEDAINQAQRIAPGRPLRQKAQGLIARWQLEIEALAQLEKARAIAQSGSIVDLTAGITQAALVNRNNPRWSEAQQQIKTWTAQIESVQDRPILDLADQIAAPGDIASLQAAIAQAKQVPQGRALTGEARSKIQTWTGQIQRTQDQPILDQARAFASAGDLKNAISVAQQIAAGRSLYDDAQADIQKWRNTINTAQAQAEAQQTLQQARNQANAGSPGALSNAIQMADRVPNSSNLRSDANTAINEWSQQLLQVAKTQAGYDPRGAIAIAQKIPARASSYAEAQQLIRSWQKTSQ